MTMRILVARERATAYHVEVLLDTAQVDEAGTPDPAWVRSFDYGKDRGALTKAAHLTQIRAAIKEQCLVALAAMVPAETTIGGFEGTDL